jgi:hypothetical protein
MKRQLLVALTAVGIFLGTATADATPFRGRSLFAKAKAVPELSTGSVGGAIAVIVGGVLVIAGYRRKRRSER